MAISKKHAGVPSDLHQLRLVCNNYYTKLSSVEFICQAIKDDKQEVVDNWLKYDKKRVRIQDKHGYTPVHYAAKFNRLEILRKLRETGSAGKGFLA